jgi:hypothetical protein
MPRLDGAAQANANTVVPVHVADIVAAERGRGLVYSNKGTPRLYICCELPNSAPFKPSLNPTRTPAFGTRLRLGKRPGWGRKAAV